MKVGFGTASGETLHPSPIVASTSSILSSTASLRAASPSCFVPSLDGGTERKRTREVGDASGNQTTSSPQSPQRNERSDRISAASSTHSKIVGTVTVPRRRRRRLWLLHRVMVSKQSTQRKRLLSTCESTVSAEDAAASDKDQPLALKDRVMLLTGLRSISPVHSAKRQRLQL
jgi:hypothetical protein